MAVATITVYEAAIKQGWTQDTIEAQFDKGDALWEMLEKRRPSEVLGFEAYTPVQIGRGGGYTAVGKDGSAELNTAAPQQTAKAKWELRRHWNPIKIDTAAIKRTKGDAQAVTESADLEMEGNISDMRNQITRQLFLDQTALIAQCATTAESATIKLKTTGALGLGYQAIRNGWLSVGQEVDVGTKTEEAVKVDKKAITAVSESEGEPTITFAAAVSGGVGETHYVSIANARSGATSLETNGFRNLIDESLTVGNLNPATYQGWKGVVDSSGGAISRAKVLTLKRRIRQKGENPDTAVTSLKQVEALEAELYPQVRFANPGDVNTGDGEAINVGKVKVQGHEECPDGDFNLFKLDRVACLRDDKPEWVVAEFEGGKLFSWNHGSTYLENALEYYFELYTNRRNALGALRELA
jgi:hypothetical protein